MDGPEGGDGSDVSEARIDLLGVFSPWFYPTHQVHYLLMGGEDFFLFFF
jgi:hypothetical protein